MADSVKHFPDILGRLGEIGLLEERDLLAETSQLFVANAAAMLQEMKESAARGDAKAVERAAHRLKGAALNLGVGSMATPARELEEQARKGDLASVPSVVAGLEQELVAVGHFLDSLTAGAGIS